MKHHELREFADRDWAQLSDTDRSYWVAEYRRNGFASTQKASQTLWQHMKSIRPEWPDAVERQHDLNHHIAQKQLLIRISNDCPSYRSA